ncbi:MAG: IS66 family transposase [Pirellulaceae bacterium]
MRKRRFRIPPHIDQQITPEVREYIVQLAEGYEKKIRELEKRIEELEARFAKLTPQNSSLPPSVQHPHAKPKPAAKKSDGPRKKQGAQPGHRGNFRELVPLERCDHVEDRHPTSCRKCQRPLVGSDPEPLRHQVIELPEIHPRVSEYRLHRLTCKCGTQTCASLPAGVTPKQFGPRLAAFCGLLLGHFRQSRRRAAAFLSNLLNVPCSTGWTIKIQNAVSDALEESYEELRQQLPQQPQLFVDESPTKEQNKKAWLWVAVASEFTVFGVFPDRTRCSLQQLLGNYAGTIINCDRAKMYLDADRLQWCWAHLKRDLQQLIDHRDGQAQRLGRDLMREYRKLFERWHRYKQGEISWKIFQDDVEPIRHQFSSYLLRGKFAVNPAMSGMCEELLKHVDWLWTFTEVEGLEPTNNAAERALRPAVIHRKLSFGTQSRAGSRFLERMLTVVETCRQQSRSPFEFLTQAIEASFHNTKPPSLLIPSTPNTLRKVA